MPTKSAFIRNFNIARFRKNADRCTSFSRSAQLNGRSAFKNLRPLQPRSTPNSSSCFFSCDFRETILGNKGEVAKTSVPSKSNDGESAKLSPSFTGTVESWGRGEISGWLKSARLMREILPAEVRSSRATSELNKRLSLRRIDSSFLSLKSLPVIIRRSNERCVAQTQTELNSLSLSLSLSLKNGIVTELYQKRYTTVQQQLAKRKFAGDTAKADCREKHYADQRVPISLCRRIDQERITFPFPPLSSVLYGPSRCFVACFPALSSASGSSNDLPFPLSGDLSSISASRGRDASGCQLSAIPLLRDTLTNLTNISKSLSIFRPDSPFNV